MLQEPRRLNFPSMLQGDKVGQWEDGREEEAPTTRVGVGAALIVLKRRIVLKQGNRTPW
jgi:hypothetical protein